MGFNFGSNTAKAYLGDVEIAGGGGNQPTLNAPTISISSGVVTITPSQNNGNFASGTFKIYAGSTLIATQSLTSFNLQNYMEENEWEEGTYSITASESGTNFIDGVSSASSFVFEYPEPPAPVIAYVKFTGTEAFTLGNSGQKAYNGSVSYSTNNLNWYTWDGTSTISSSQSAPFELYLKGTGNTHFGKSYTNYTNFRITSTNPVSVSGNIMALLDYASVESEIPITMDNYCFVRLFYGTNINDASTLLFPNTLSTYCFAQMFWNCTSLTTAPQLPATTLGVYCYSSMFDGCTSLTTAPQLPALTAVYACYGSMFKGCTSLTTAPQLPATTLANYCYNSMFKGCTSLTTPPQLPVTTLVEGCYDSMFEGCTSLTTPPQLPATTIREKCYSNMFKGCTGLIVSDTQTAQATHTWRIPTENTFTIGLTQYNMFLDCRGSRASNDMAGESGQAYTYYTQNEPI